MKSNIIKYYFANLNDHPCGHAHKTFLAAEKCVAKTIRAAKRGETFYLSDYAAKRTVEMAAAFVASKVVAR